MVKIIRAVAGALYREGMVLMATRPEPKVYAGFWEFPGGKLEDGEAPQSALERELLEELGIGVNPKDCEELMFMTEAYEHGIVHLYVFVIRSWSGRVRPCENQNFAWQHLDQECNLSPLLPTTEKILTKLKRFK